MYSISGNNMMYHHADGSMEKTPYPAQWSYIQLHQWVDNYNNSLIQRAERVLSLFSQNDYNLFLEDTECRQVLESIPEGMIPNAADLLYTHYQDIPFTEQDYQTLLIGFNQLHDTDLKLASCPDKDTK
jgi:hypothetical protein